MKILHIADEHVRDKDIDECDRCLDFIVDAAKAENPLLIVSSGDWFDSQEVKADSRAAKLVMKTISKLADIAPVAIITGTKTHDGNAPEILKYARGKYDIHVSTYPEQVFLHDGYFYRSLMGNGQPDAILTLIPTITKQYFKTAAGIAEADQEIAQQMNGLFMGFGAQAAAYKAPHLLLWHGGISGARLPSGHVRTGMEIEISTDQIRLAGGNHDFLGCFYSGPLYPVKIDEQDCGFWIHDLEERDFIACLGHIHQTQQIGGDRGTDVASRHVATPCRQIARLKYDETVSAVDDPLSAFGHITDIEERAINVSGKDVTVEIKVWQDKAAEFDRGLIEEALRNRGALSVDIRVSRVPRIQVRSESVLAASSLADKLIESARLRGETVAPEVLEMARILEHSPAEDLMKMVMEGCI